MVHFNKRSRYLGEINGMKAAFQNNHEQLVQLLLTNIQQAEQSKGELYNSVSDSHSSCM